MNPPDPHALTATHESALNEARIVLGVLTDREAVETLAALMLRHGVSVGELTAEAMRVRALPR